MSDTRLNDSSPTTCPKSQPLPAQRFKEESWHSFQLERGFAFYFEQQFVEQNFVLGNKESACELRPHRGNAQRLYVARAANWVPIAWRNLVWAANYEFGPIYELLYFIFRFRGPIGILAQHICLAHAPALQIFPFAATCFFFIILDLLLVIAACFLRTW